MTSRLVMTKKDPRRTDFVLVDDTRSTPATSSPPIYSSDTARYARPRNGCCAMTTVTRIDHTGDRLQVGIIEWPVRSGDPAQLVVGTRGVPMFKLGNFTSSERFTAVDGCEYEWQVQDARPQLVPIRQGYSRASTSYVATFVQSHSGFCLWRKHMSSLFIPPEGFRILDDIIVTFIYFESGWRDKESAKSHSSVSGSVL